MLKTMKTKLHSPMGRDVIWTFSVQMLVMLCGFIITKILSNRLSIDDFGLYNMIKRSAGVLSFVILAGTGIAIPRYLPIFRNQKEPFSCISFSQATLLMVLAIAVIVSIVCLCLPNFWSSIIVGSHQVSLLVLALLYSFSFATASFLYAYFRGTNQFRQFNLSQAVIQLCCIFPLLLLPVLTVQKVYLAWVIIMLGLVSCFTIMEIHRHHYVFLRRFNIAAIRRQLKEAFSYSAPRMIGDFFLFSINAFPIIYLGYYYSFRDVAFFSVGLTFVTLGTSLFSILGYILLPYVSGALARHEIKEVGGTINRLLYIYIAAAILATLLFVLITPFMIRLFFASNYLVTTDLTRIMLLAILPQSIYLLYRNPIDAISKTPYNTLNLGICLTIMVFAFYQLNTLQHFAYAFLGVCILKGMISILTWEVLKKKKI